MNAKILILGAGIYQVPLIIKAAARGYETFVASMAGRYPGIDLADRFFAIDIRDIPGILELVQTHHISAIITTGADAGIPTIGAVVDQLGLRGPSRKIAETVSSKTAFRAFLRAHAHNHPDFYCCLNASDAWSFYQFLNQRTVIKPDDASGSRGVAILEPGLLKEVVAAAYVNAVRYSTNGRVCIEAFIEGVETGGDAFFFDGELAFFTTTDKHLNGVIVQGHSLPNPLPLADRKRLEEEIRHLAGDLGYHDGPLNFDAMIQDSKIYLLEVGIRNGGNGIVDLIYHSEGVDLLEMTLDYSLGNSVAVNRSKEFQSVSSYVFGAGRSGTLRSITSLAALREKVPEVFDMVLAKNQGDEIEAFIHNANLIGYLLMHGGSSEYGEICSAIQNHLHIEIQS